MIYIVSGGALNSTHSLTMLNIDVTFRILFFLAVYAIVIRPAFSSIESLNFVL